MTHDEIIEVIKAHRDDKQLQVFNPACYWEDLGVPYCMSALLFRINNGYKIRVKPEPTYVPWTANDWINFKDETIYLKKNKQLNWIIHYWNDCGVFAFSNNENIIKERYVDYTVLLDNYCLENNKPCGKLVEK